MIKERLKKQTVSFKYAFKGFYYGLVSQPNFQVHIFLASVAAGLGLYFGLNLTEWTILVLTVSAVLTAELFNTALEIITDALKVHKKTEKDDFYIMVAKDVAAGAVLLTAMSSLVVGVLLFAPKFGWFG